MNTFVLYLISAGTSFLLTALSLPLMYRYLKKFFLDAPGGLKTHARAVPVLGGSGIFIGVLGSLVLIRFITAFPSGTLHNLRGLFIGGLLIFIMGLLDDLRKPRGLSISLKLLLQATATAALIYYDVSIHIFESPWLSYPLTFLWVMGLTNAFNLLDIQDGLCISQVIICTLGLTVVALPNEQIYVNFAALSLLGAALAFWPYNHAKKKKIFLGDSGSNFLGFTLAALSMGTEYSRHTDWGVLAPLLILAVPVFDTAFVCLARVLKGKNPLKGSDDHAALRLQKQGVKKSHILILFMVAGITANTFAFFLIYSSWKTALLLLGITAWVMIDTTLYLLKEHAH